MPRPIAFSPRPDDAPVAAGEPSPLPVVLSIVEYDPALGEEVFLSFSTGQGQENGPGITRTGDRAPSMRRFWDRECPWGDTTDPDEQRIGTWFTDKPSADLEIADWDRAKLDLQQSQEAGGPPQTIDRLQRRLSVLNLTSQLAAIGHNHISMFETNYPNYRVIGQQGCGDLSMNKWYVAHAPSPLTMNPTLVWLFDEPILDRTYSCLVKWKRLRGAPVTIEEGVRFQPVQQGHSVVRIDGRVVTNTIEFAVFGKQVIRNGRPVDLGSYVDQFSDLRHLLLLPDLNPKEKFREDEETHSVGGRCARYYYGQEWTDSVWLGEKQLLDDPNLQRAALLGPVVLNRLYGGMGASEQQVRDALGRARYDEAPDPRSLRLGQWKIIPWDKKLLAVHFRPSMYPWNMIGVGKNQNGRTCVYCFGSNGRQGRSGYTLREAVTAFLTRTAAKGVKLQDALLMDEGNDVFQKVLKKGRLETTIPLRRRQVRASLIFATAR